MKAQNLKSMNKMVAKDTLEQMWLKRKIINYNLKDLSKSIYSSNWFGHESLSQIGSSVFGFASTKDYELCREGFLINKITQFDDLKKCIHNELNI